jgi:hypothetical protein
LQRFSKRSIRRALLGAMIMVPLWSAAAAQTSAPKPSATPARPPLPKAMTNADVVKMTHGDLGDDLIITAIKKAPRTAFDLSADGLLQLRAAGVSKDILRVMLDPTAKVTVLAPPVERPASPAKTETPPSPTTKPPAPAAAAESAPARNTQREQVPGEASFTSARAYDAAFDAILSYLKKQDQVVEFASRDSGEITTAMTITGGSGQSGRRIRLTLIKDNATTTTVRVAVTLQTRKKAAQTEPWSDPTVDLKQSRLAADELKALLTR